jgi:hypothetical protein
VAAYGLHGRGLVSCGEDQTLRVWDVSRLDPGEPARPATLVGTLHGHTGRVFALAAFAMAKDRHFAISGTSVIDHSRDRDSCRRACVAGAWVPALHAQRLGHSAGGGGGWLAGWLAGWQVAPITSCGYGTSTPCSPAAVPASSPSPSPSLSLPLAPPTPPLSL